MTGIVEWSLPDLISIKPFLSSVQLRREVIEQVGWGPHIQRGSKTGKPGKEEASRKDLHVLMPQRNSNPKLKDPAPSPALVPADWARALISEKYCLCSGSAQQAQVIILLSWLNHCPSSAILATCTEKEVPLPKAQSHCHNSALGQVMPGSVTLQPCSAKCQAASAPWGKPSGAPCLCDRKRAAKGSNKTFKINTTLMEQTLQFDPCFCVCACVCM